MVRTPKDWASKIRTSVNSYDGKNKPADPAVGSGDLQVGLQMKKGPTIRPTLTKPNATSAQPLTEIDLFVVQVPLYSLSDSDQTPY